MKKIKNAGGTLIIFALILFGMLAMLLGRAATSAGIEAFAENDNTQQVLVIDAGHGQPDGGAVSAKGTLESDINLAVALKLRALGNFFGVDCVMTRETAEAIYSPDAQTIRQKKVSDLKNRVELINGVENAFLISIHQNSYTDPKYSGAQVFYADEASKPTAERIRENLSKILDDSDPRQCVDVPDSVYLFQKVNCGAVLVECGFMSNPAESELMLTEEYQKKIACAVLAAYLSGSTGQGNEVYQ